MNVPTKKGSTSEFYPKTKPKFSQNTAKLLDNNKKKVYL